MFGKLVTIDLDKKDDIVHLEPIGDPHFGHIGFKEDLYVERMKAMIGVDIRYKGKTLRRWKIFTQHGAGGGTNPLTALDQMKVNHIADVYLMGHLHNKL